MNENNANLCEMEQEIFQIKLIGDISFIQTRERNRTHDRDRGI